MKRTVAVFLATLVLLLVSFMPAQARVVGGVWVGPGWGPGWWGPPYGYGYPYGYPYYAAPPVVIQQQPEEYVHQPTPQPEQQYWYFCRESKTYYPYVKSCPGGWMRVAPTPAPTPAPPTGKE